MNVNKRAACDIASLFIRKILVVKIRPISSTMAKNDNVTEGKATIYVSDVKSSDVFYNPVQQFNRDMSIAAINQFAKDRESDEKFSFPDGLTILEALSATGLRSVRYAQEIPRAKKIVANDFSKRAVDSIDLNIQRNGVADKVESSHSDAAALMAKFKGKQTKFDVIDLDPYGSPTHFLDSAVQSVAEGGLLCVTATDMAVLCGNAPETCYSKYGAVSLRGKNSHEMALRIALQCIEAHANRYGRYIEPLLSLSIDFYVRIFVRVFTSQKKCKETSSKLGHVYQCSGCESISYSRLGEVVTDDKGNKKYVLPKGPPVDQKCKYCFHSHHVGGPFWLAPIHDMGFVSRLREGLESNEDHSFGTIERMAGMLAVVNEELADVPFYYIQDRLCSIIKTRMDKLTVFRSAILNGGYRVSLSHAHKLAFKTDAPNDFIWDMMRAYEKLNPSNKDNWNDVCKAILGREDNFTSANVNFAEHPDAEPPSRSSKLLRFQINPPNWGPKSRAKAVSKEDDKRAKNQGKYTAKKRLNNEDPSSLNKKGKVD